MKPDLPLGAGSLRFGAVTHVMGVINLSPESRNRPTVVHAPHEALEMAQRYREWGATLVDLGGQSSHFESPEVPLELELQRLIPVVELLASEHFLVSVDTWKPAVAQAALAAGAVIINDTGGLQEPLMRKLAAKAKAAVVVVYVEAANPHQVGSIDARPAKAARTAAWFRQRLEMYRADGIEGLILDPGIALNYRGDYETYTKLQIEVIRESRELHALGYPVLIPIPRKREDHRVMAYITLAVEYQADIIRVHDVREACDLVTLLGRAAR